MNKKQIKYFIVCLLIACIGSLTSLVIGDFLYWKDRYPPNCYFENIEVSTLRKHEAFDKIKDANVDDATIGYISLRLSKRLLKFVPSEIGIKVDPERSISNATSTAYQHNFLKEIFKRVSRDTRPIVIPLVLRVDKMIYRPFLEGVATNVAIASKDAEVEILTGGKYLITKEIIGKKLAVEISLKNIEMALSKNLRSATIEVITLYPRVYYKDLEAHPPVKLLSQFTTHYGVHNSSNRIHNIKHAASKINNYILLSGEVYSLFNIIGDPGTKEGFKDAFVVVGDALDSQSGGGLCQVSTTLYNSAILAGLDIIERYNHRLYFDIYPLGRDATVYGKSKDLKFKNDLGYPVLIKTQSSNTSITVKIFGTPIPGRQIYFTSPTVYINGEKPFSDTPKQVMGRIREILDKTKKKPFVTSVRIVFFQDNRVIDEKKIESHYSFAAFKDNVKIINPEVE